jgi:putative ABC transport system permease protein
LRLRDYFFMSFHNLSINALRSLLTMLGIIIGTASLIATVSIGFGGQQRIEMELGKLGIDEMVITSKADRTGMRAKLWAEDIQRITERIDQIDGGYPVLSDSAQLSANTKTVPMVLCGTTSEFFRLDKLTLLHGRFLSPLDSGNAVIVIGEEVAGDLFPDPQDALGQHVLVNQLSCEIVGVYENSFSISQNRNTYMPVDVAEKLLGTNEMTRLAFYTSHTDNLVSLGRDATRLLLEYHAPQYGIYSTATMARELELAEQVITIFVLVMASMAVLAMLSGGIGVMNIMLVSVKERTREIGIRKALGARDSQISLQFLIEAALLSMTGGALGVGAGALLAYVAAGWIEIPYVWLGSAALVAVVFCALVGFCFGVYPAGKASKLDPVESLRQE